MQTQGEGRFRRQGRGTAIMEKAADPTTLASSPSAIARLRYPPAEFLCTLGAVAGPANGGQDART